MTFNFCRKVFSIGSGDVQSPLQFYKKGFELTSNGTSPSWRDIILSGNTALTLANAKADGLNYVKLFGGTEQNGTPTPTTPMNIVCNNGVLKLNNVHNIATDTLGGFISKSTGEIVSNAVYGYTDYIPVTAGQVFKITQRGSSTTNADGVAQYDSNKVWQSCQGVSGLGGTYTVPDGISYIRPNFNINYQQFVVEDGVYADGTVETINVHGKNLYNDATRTDGYYIGADGVIAQGSGTFCHSALIPVKPNTNYMLSGIASQSNSRRLHAYDSNGNWISQISFATISAGNTYNITGTTPNNCVYVRISIPMADTNIQVEQGSTATEYEPYFNGGSLECPMLLSVGSYQDEFILEN